MKPTISKSNVVEIIAILWLIAGLVAALTKQHHLLRLFCYFMFGWNTAESIIWAIKDIREGLRDA